jgi:hypothetical protein
MYLGSGVTYEMDQDINQKIKKIRLFVEKLAQHWNGKQEISLAVWQWGIDNED